MEIRLVKRCKKVKYILRTVVRRLYCTYFSLNIGKQCRIGPFAQKQGCLLQDWDYVDPEKAIIFPIFWHTFSKLTFFLITTNLRVQFDLLFANQKKQHGFKPGSGKIILFRPDLEKLFRSGRICISIGYMQSLGTIFPLAAKVFSRNYTPTLVLAVLVRCSRLINPEGGGPRRGRWGPITLPPRN